MKRKEKGREGREVCEEAQQGVVHVCLCKCVCNLHFVFLTNSICILQSYDSCGGDSSASFEWKKVMNALTSNSLSYTHIHGIPLLQFQLSERVSALTHQLLTTIQTHMTGKSC